MKSNWSKVNKDRVKQLIDAKLMEPAGLAAIQAAKLNGAWTALDDVEQTVIPEDLKACFHKNNKAYNNWKKFSRSSRRGILEWILNAKKPDTRQRRIEQTVALAENNVKANYPV